MNRKSNWTRIKYAFAFAVAVGTAGAVTNFVGCGTTATTTYATTDPYLYTTYYPADVAYSSVYWTDDWLYTGLYAVYTPVTGAAGSSGTTVVVTTTGTAGTTGTTTTTGTAGTTGTTTTTTGGGVITTAGDAIRALARGDSVCPGQVTVTPKTAPPACAGGSSRAGVTIVFTNCQTPGGATLNGTVDVTSTRTASATTCDANTTITLSHTTTITNLSYASASGAVLMIPSQTGTGMSTYMFGQTPPTMALSYNGELQITGSNGTLSSDHSYTANATFSFGGSATGYTVDGGLTVTDNLATGVGTTITVTGLQRVTTCCRPVGGTVNIVQTSASGPGSHVIGFGPSCGSATIDGTSATLPACI